MSQKPGTWKKDEGGGVLGFIVLIVILFLIFG